MLFKVFEMTRNISNVKHERELISKIRKMIFRLEEKSQVVIDVL